MEKVGGGGRQEEGVIQYHSIALLEVSAIFEIHVVFRLLNSQLVYEPKRKNAMFWSKCSYLK